MDDSWKSQMIASGISPDEARLLTDIAAHAVQSALETMMRICDSAEDERGKTLCSVIACGLMTERMQIAGKEMDGVLREIKRMYTG